MRRNGQTVSFNVSLILRSSSTVTLCVLHLDVCVRYTWMCVCVEAFVWLSPSTFYRWEKMCCQVHILCLPVYLQHFGQPCLTVGLSNATYSKEVNKSLCSLNAKLTLWLLPYFISVEHWTRNQHSVVYRITQYIYFCAAFICIKYSSTSAEWNLRLHGSAVYGLLLI